MKKIRGIIFSLIGITIGMLAIGYLNVLGDFDPYYFSSSSARAAEGILCLLIFFLIIKLIWGKIGCGLAIAFGLMAILRCILPNKEQTSFESLAIENDSTPNKAWSGTRKMWCKLLSTTA